MSEEKCIIDEKKALEELDKERQRVEKCFDLERIKAEKYNEGFRDGLNAIRRILCSAKVKSTAGDGLRGEDCFAEK